MCAGMLHGRRSGALCSAELCIIKQARFCKKMQRKAAKKERQKFGVARPNVIFARPQRQWCRGTASALQHARARVRECTRNIFLLQPPAAGELAAVLGRSPSVTHVEGERERERERESERNVARKYIHAYKVAAETEHERERERETGKERVELYRLPRRRMARSEGKETGAGAERRRNERERERERQRKRLGVEPWVSLGRERVTERRGSGGSCRGRVVG